MYKRAFRYKRHVMKVFRDDTYYNNPRTDMSNMSVFVIPAGCRYLTDEYEKHTGSPFDFGSYDGWEDAKKALENDPDILWVSPLSVTDHSRVVINLGKPTDAWDSSMCGFCVVTRKSFLDTMGKWLLERCEKGDEDAIELLQKNVEREVDRLQRHFDGDVWAYEIFEIPERFSEDAFEDHDLFEAADKYFTPITCSGGWYCDPEEVTEEAIAELVYYVRAEVSVIIRDYGYAAIFDSREEAINAFKEAALSCDPGSSEAARYREIIDDLEEGKTHVSA